MKTSRLLVSGLLLAGLLQRPTLLFGQNKDIVSLQRDIAQLEIKIADLKTAQTARMDSVDTQIRQVLDSNIKLSSALAAIQKNLTDTVGAVSSLNEQQGKQMLTPLANVSSKVDTMATEFSELKLSLNALQQTVSKFDTRLGELNNTMRTLSTPPPAPPTAANGTATQTGPAGGTALGTSANAMYDNAQHDYYGAKYDLAIEEFRSFLEHAPNSDNGPKAYYYIGQSYFRGGQFDDAVKAFDAGIERYSENPTTPDLQWMKAQALMKAERRPEAIAEFRSFIAKYPSDPNRTSAQSYLEQLTKTPAKPAGRGAKKGR